MSAAIKLYELAAARDILDEFLAETEGEVTPELQQLLDELEGDTKEKIERVALYIREQLALAGAVKVEEDRLAARRKSLERAADGLKAYLKMQMERIGAPKVTGLLCTVALQNNPPAVRCALTSDELLAHFVGAVTDSRLEQFVREVPASYRLDSRAVLDAFKAGHPIPTEVTIEQGTHLRIR
jgi:hypothetical protein